MIPIKGYATFHPLKHCWIGSGFKPEWFEDLAIYKNKKIMDPLKKIADETEEDFQILEKILKNAGVKTYRNTLNMEKYKSLKNVWMPPICPRDHFAVIGEKIYTTVSVGVHKDILKKIDTKNIHLDKNITKNLQKINTAELVRVGKDLFWDINDKDWVEQIEENNIKVMYSDKYNKKDILEEFRKTNTFVNYYKSLWESQGFRVHLSYRGYHSDGGFCLVKPGCIVSLHDIQDYSKEFPGWEVLYLPDQGWQKVSPWLKFKNKVGGRWWVKGEEHNDQLIKFVNTWLNDWVGYVEETVFDVNMLSIDENTIVCNNYNKEVFNFFKKHKVEPIVFNFRHRYFWDGGVHCITQDLYREGKQEDYFG